MLRVLLTFATIGLLLYALIDCIRTDDSLVRGLPKILWILLIVLAWIVGPLAWIVAGRNRSSGPPQRPVRRGPLAPDDDPDFLRELDIKRKRRENRPEDESPTS